MDSIIFCRVSSSEQEESGYSLPSQIKTLTDYAQKKGFTIKNTFSISESASGTKQRQEFQKMFKFVKEHKIKILIFEKVDRVTRNFKDAVTIDEWLDEDPERQLHLVKDNIILHKNSRSREEFDFAIRVVLAKEQIDRLSEEVRKGQKEKLAQGWLPTSPPIGYKTVGDQGHKIHVIDPNTSPLVTRMFELYASGTHSLKSITETMEKEGLRNSRGSVIVKSRIHQLLQNPFYINMNRWNGINHEGKQETFISVDVFNKVQRLMKSKNAPKLNKHNYVLKGFMRCEVCEGAVTWESKKGITYGHCNYWYNNCSQGNQDWLKETEIINQLTEKLDKLKIRSVRLSDWIRKSIRERHKDEIEYNTSSTSAIQTQIEKYEKRLDRIYLDRVDEIIPEEKYQVIKKETEQNLKLAQGQLSQHATAPTRYYNLGINYYEISQHGTLLLTKLKDIEDKQKLLRMVFKSMKVKDRTAITEFTKPFEILAKAVEQTNQSSKMQNLDDNENKVLEPMDMTYLTTKTEGFEAFRPVLLPLVDAFRNRKIELNINLQLLQNFFTDWQLTPSFA